MVIEAENLSQPRDMEISDLDDVVEVHKKCFSVSVSVFSALSPDFLKLYYQMFIDEPESYAAVLEDRISGHIAGVTFGTRNPGIQGRFLKKYRSKFFWVIFKAFFTNKAIWKAALVRLSKKNSLSLGKYEPGLLGFGIPAPKGPEDINMGIAIHPDFRGSGNADRLIEFYKKKVFQYGVARIRGAILSSNVASIICFKRLGWTLRKTSDTQFSIWINRPD